MSGKHKISLLNGRILSYLFYVQQRGLAEKTHHRSRKGCLVHPLEARMRTRCPKMGPRRKGKQQGQSVIASVIYIYIYTSFHHK